jgi:hypothetical protein
MASNDLRKVDSFQFPAAHLGHLSESQQKALDRFKEVCQENGYYHHPGSEGHTYASHDDETLLYVFHSVALTSKSSLISVYLLIGL